MLAISTNNIVSNLNLNLEQKKKLGMVLKGLQTITESHDLFIRLLSETERYLLYIKKKNPQELNEYIKMIKTGPDNRENVKKVLEKKIKDILNKMNLNTTGTLPQIEKAGRRKKKARTKKMKKGKSQSRKRFSKKSNKKKMRGGSNNLGEELMSSPSPSYTLPSHLITFIILLSIFMFLSSMVPNVLYVVITMIIFITLSYPTRDKEGPLSEFLKARPRKPVFPQRKIIGQSTGNRFTEPYFNWSDFDPPSMPSKNWPFPEKMDPGAPNRVRSRIKGLRRGQNFNDEGINSS